MLNEMLKEIEIWKTITYPDVRRNMYEVSTFGRIRNKNTMYILKDFSDKAGYRVLELATEIPNHGKTFKVHRLVAYEFIFNIENKPEVNHKDGDKSNNHDWNLEWVTSKENQIHAYETGLQRNRYGEEHPSAKISDDDVENICKYLIECNGDIYEVYSKLNIDVDISTIKSIKYKQNWTHISDKYFGINTFRKMLTSDIVEDICKILVKCDFNIKETQTMLKEIYPDMDFSYKCIQHIKLGNTWRHVSEKYFKR